MDLAFCSRATNAPEDRVVFPLLVSCRDITEEILFAIANRHGRAALRATRTMYECLVVARYLNLHPEKTEDFLSMFHAEWARVCQDIPAAYRCAEMDSAIATHVPKYAQGKRVGMNDLNWSGAQIHDMAREAGPLAELHSSAYTLSSAYIHPGAMFYLGTLSPSSQDGNIIKVSEGTQDREAKYALRTAHDLLLNAVDLRLKYEPALLLRNAFDSCSTDFVRIWGYKPHI